MTRASKVLLVLLIAVCAALAAGVVLLPQRARGAPAGDCIKIDARALIATTQGYSVALCPDRDDAPCQYATVLARDVRYWDGPLLLCMPPAGMLRLWLPSRAWPAFARTPVAAAHGDFAWIGDGRYRSTSGEHCCGWADCREIDPATVRADGREHDTPLGRVPNGAVYQSQDGRAWICRAHLAPERRCLFLPGGF